MFEARDNAEESRNISLLSLGRALEEERARAESQESAEVEASPAPSSDAATLHRAERARREARQGPLMDALSRLGDPDEQPVPPDAATPAVAADAEAVPSADDREGPPALDEPPWQPAAAREPETPRPQRLPARRDFGAAARDDRDDDRWRPLIDPHMVFGRIARSKALIASTTLAGAILGIAIALSTPKQYQAIAEVLVDPRDLKIVEREITTPGLPSEATLAIIENQGRILTSGPVLTTVVEKLNLTSDPEFNGQDGSRLTSLLNPIAFVRSLLSRSDAPDNARLESRATAALAEKVTVERTGKTFILNVEVSTADAEKSALIANTLIDTYLDAAGRLQSATAGRATSELTSRLEELRKSVEEAEDRVEEFKAQNDIIDPQGRSIADEELIKLNDQLSIARARTLEIDAKAASARQLDIGSVLSGGLPEGMNSSALTELRSQYASVKQAVDNANVRLGPRHPQRQALEAQLAGAREQINAELRRIVSSIQVELKRAVELEQDLAARLAQLKVRRGSTSQDLVKLRELERDANSRRAVYESFLLRARETGEQKDLNTANVSVISRADPPLEPTGPSRAVLAGTGTMAGLLAGIGIAGMLGALDSLRSPTRRAGRRRDDTDPERSGEPEATNSSRAAPPAPHSATPQEVDMATNHAPHTASTEARQGYYWQAAPMQQRPEPYPAPQPAYAGMQPPHYPHAPAMSQPAPSAPYWPQAAQPGWQAPADMPQVWPQPQPQAYAPAQTGYAPPPPFPYGPPGATPPSATPVQIPSDVIRSLNESIDDIRSIVRECRDAMRAMADKHARRFF